MKSIATFRSLVNKKIGELMSEFYDPDDSINK